MQCRHCGRCVGKCPFHTIADGIYGYKIYIGGRWGKKISRGKSLSKIFASKEEALNVIEKAILFFRDNGLKGERFAETIERIGFENVEKELLALPISVRIGEEEISAKANTNWRQ